MVKHKDKQMKSKYSEDEKRALVAKYATGVASVTALSKAASVAAPTFYQWIHRYGGRFGSISEGEFSAIHFRRITQMLERERKIKEILTSVNCTPLSPHKIKLAEIDRLHDELPDRYSIRLLCEALNFNHATFVNHLKTRGNVRWYDVHNATVEELTKQVFDEFHQWYGADKISAVLRQRGHKIGVASVRNAMQKLNLCSIRGFAKSLYEKDKLSEFKDLVKRNFNPTAPNVIWVTDTTEFWCKGRKFYICAILDLFARRIVAWNISFANNTRLVLRTAEEAFNSRGKPQGVILHSDRGTNMKSYHCLRRLKALGIIRSFSHSATPYDNSVCESFFRSLKTEELYRHHYKSVAEFRKSVADYMEAYNSIRIHEAIHYLTPDQKESAYWAEWAQVDTPVQS